MTDELKKKLHDTLRERSESRLCILSIRLRILSPWLLDFRQGFRLCLTGSGGAAEARSVLDLEVLHLCKDLVHTL